MKKLILAFQLIVGIYISAQDYPKIKPEVEGVLLIGTNEITFPYPLFPSAYLPMAIDENGNFNLVTEKPEIVTFDYKINILNKTPILNKEALGFFGGDFRSLGKNRYILGTIDVLGEIGEGFFVLNNQSENWIKVPKSYRYLLTLNGVIILDHQKDTFLEFHPFLDKNKVYQVSDLLRQNQVETVLGPGWSMGPSGAVLFKGEEQPVNIKKILARLDQERKLHAAPNKLFTTWIDSQIRKREFYTWGGAYLGRDSNGNYFGTSPGPNTYDVISADGEVKASYRADFRAAAPPEWLALNQEEGIQTSGWQLNPVDGNLYNLVGYYDYRGRKWVGNKLYLYKAPREW